MFTRPGADLQGPRNMTVPVVGRLGRCRQSLYGWHRAPLVHIPNRVCQGAGSGALSGGRVCLENREALKAYMAVRGIGNKVIMLWSLPQMALALRAGEGVTGNGCASAQSHAW